MILYIAFLFFGSLFFMAAPLVLYHWCMAGKKKGNRPDSEAYSHAD